MFKNFIQWIVWRTNLPPDRCEFGSGDCIYGPDLGTVEELFCKKCGKSANEF